MTAGTNRPLMSKPVVSRSTESSAPVFWPPGPPAPWPPGPPAPRLVSPIGFLMLAEDSPHRIGDFAERRVCFDGADDGRHQIRRAACRGRDLFEGGAARRAVSRRSNGAHAPDL